MLLSLSVPENLLPVPSKQSTNVLGGAGGPNSAIVDKNANILVVPTFMGLPKADDGELMLTMDIMMKIEEQ